MKTQPGGFHIGHLKIADHLILAVAGYLLKNNDTPLSDRSFNTTAFNSWDLVCDHLIQGSINGAFLPIPMALDLFGKGLDMQLIMFTHRGGQVLAKRHAHEINQINDFKGRIILTSSILSIEHMLFHRMLSSAGLNMVSFNSDDNDVTHETAVSSVIPDMLENDTDVDIAGFAYPELFVSQRISQNSARKICCSGDLWPDHPCCAFVLKNDIIHTAGPDLVSSLISLLMEAARFLEQKEHNWIYPEIQSFLNIPEAMVEPVIKGSSICFSPRLLVPDPVLIKIIQDYMVDEMGVLSKKVNLERFVNSTYINIEKLDMPLEN